MKLLKLIGAMCGLAGLVCSVYSQYTFQYDRSRTDAFSGISYSGYNDLQGRADLDFSLKGDVGGFAGRASFYYNTSLKTWLENNPTAAITSAIFTGTAVTAITAVGPLNYSTIVFDMTTNVSFWPTTGPAAEASGWIDWNYSLTSDILTQYTSPCLTTGTLDCQAAIPSYTMDITAQIQYIQANPGTPWGIIFVSTGGTGRIGMLAYENYGPANPDQTTAAEGVKIIVQASVANQAAALSPASAARLLACQPNPFNQQTKIGFSLPRSQPVSVGIYDVNGRLVKNLLRASLAAGQHSLVWNGVSNAGTPAANGVYLLQLKAGSQVLHQNLLLNR